MALSVVVGEAAELRAASPLFIRRCPFSPTALCVSDSLLLGVSLTATAAFAASPEEKAKAAEKAFAAKEVAAEAARLKAATKAAADFEARKAVENAEADAAFKKFTSKK